jgi:YegS/Rv2252/BmrU family lipid kinase
VDVSLTATPGHAIDLARQAAREGRKLVVAVGGDGTLHEVANGVLEAGADTAVGYIGQGTGGDFRRTLGIEHRLDAYIDAIAAGRELRVDVGRVQYRAPSGEERRRFFVNILSAGLGGLVDRYVSDATRALGGKAAYYLASLRALARIRRGRLKCDVALDGETQSREIDSFMIAVCNGRYFGSGMHVAPMARPDDGRFEVVSLDAPNGVFLLDVDGEPLGGLPLEVELVPRALTLRA